MGLLYSEYVLMCMFALRKILCFYNLHGHLSD